MSARNQRNLSGMAWSDGIESPLPRAPEISK
jgi:hypothetical protein